jgi:hypothetical protein
MKEEKLEWQPDRRAVYVCLYLDFALKRIYRRNNSASPLRMPHPHPSFREKKTSFEWATGLSHQ